MNLFTLCETNRETCVRRVPMEGQVQRDVVEMFANQEHEFVNDRNEELEFTGEWKPDDNQLLKIEDEELASPFLEIINREVLAFDILNIRNVVNGRTKIKAVFRRSENLQHRILIQRFQRSQILSQRFFSLVLNNNQYSRLSNDGFSLRSQLAAVLDESVFKFQSFYDLKSIIDARQHFREATQEDVLNFSRHNSIAAGNLEFVNELDQHSRRLIYSVMKSEVLDNFGVDQIVEKSEQVGFNVESRDRKLVLPQNKLEVKRFLSFLMDSIYKGTFSGETFVTNSRRPLG